MERNSLDVWLASEDPQLHLRCPEKLAAAAAAEAAAAEAEPVAYEGETLQDIKKPAAIWSHFYEIVPPRIVRKSTDRYVVHHVLCRHCSTSVAVSGGILHGKTSNLVSHMRRHPDIVINPTKLADRPTQMQMISVDMPPGPGKRRAEDIGREFMSLLQTLETMENDATSAGSSSNDLGLRDDLGWLDNNNNNDSNNNNSSSSSKSKGDGTDSHGLAVSTNTQIMTQDRVSLLVALFVVKFCVPVYEAARCIMLKQFCECLDSNFVHPTPENLEGIIERLHSRVQTQVSDRIANYHLSLLGERSCSVSLDSFAGPFRARYLSVSLSYIDLNWNLQTQTVAVLPYPALDDRSLEHGSLSKRSASEPDDNGNGFDNHHNGNGNGNGNGHGSSHNHNHNSHSHSHSHHNNAAVNEMLATMRGAVIAALEQRGLSLESLRATVVDSSISGKLRFGSSALLWRNCYAEQVDLAIRAALGMVEDDTESNIARYEPFNNGDAPPCCGVTAATKLDTSPLGLAPHSPAVIQHHNQKLQEQQLLLQQQEQEQLLQAQLSPPQPQPAFLSPNFTQHRSQPQGAAGSPAQQPQQQQWAAASPALSSCSSSNGSSSSGCSSLRSDCCGRGSAAPSASVAAAALGCPRELLSELQDISRLVAEDHTIKETLAEAREEMQLPAKELDQGWTPRWWSLNAMLESFLEYFKVVLRLKIQQRLPACLQPLTSQAKWKSIAELHTLLKTISVFEKSLARDNAPTLALAEAEIDFLTRFFHAERFSVRYADRLEEIELPLSELSRVTQTFILRMREELAHRFPALLPPRDLLPLLATCMCHPATKDFAACFVGPRYAANFSRGIAEMKDATRNFLLTEMQALPGSQADFNPKPAQRLHLDTRPVPSCEEELASWLAFVDTSSLSRAQLSANANAFASKGKTFGSVAPQGFVPVSAGGAFPSSSSSSSSPFSTTTTTNSMLPVGAPLSLHTPSPTSSSSDSSSPYNSPAAAPTGAALVTNNATGIPSHLDALAFWREHDRIFPRVAAVARKLFSMPAVTHCLQAQPSEKGWTASKFRSYPSSTAERLLFLNANSTLWPTPEQLMK